MTDISNMKAVAAALHDVLTGDIGVHTYLGDRLYDDVPAAPISPYLSYGAMHSEDISADGAQITAYILTLHLWSDYAGRAEAFDALAAVIAALETGSLTIPDRDVVRLSILYADVLRTPNLTHRHGIIRVKIITEQALETL